MVSWLNECTSIEEVSGRHKAVIGIKPRAYLRDGSYRAMSFRLGDSGDPQLPFGLDELLAIRFADKLAGQSPIVHVGRGQNHIRMTAVGTQNNVPGSVVNDATGIPIGRRYDNAWTGADLEYLAGGHYLRKNVYLHAGHPAVFEFRIDGLAGTLSPSARGWDLLDDAGRPVLWAGAGYLYRPDQPDALTVPVSTTVRVQGGKSIYRYELPAGDWSGWVLEPTWTSQPGASAGLDSYIYSATATTNYGTAVDCYVGDPRMTASSGSGTLIQFSLLSLPESARVSAATLSLYELAAFDDAGGGSWAVNLHRLLRAWTEAGSTYNTYDGTNNWTTAGAQSNGNDRVATVSATVTLDGTAASAFIDWSDSQLVSDIQAFRNGTQTNYGHLLEAPTAENQGASRRANQFASSDNATAANRPTLTVEYLLPGGGIGRGRIPVLARGGW